MPQYQQTRSDHTRYKKLCLKYLDQADAHNPFITHLIEKYKGAKTNIIKKDHFSTPITYIESLQMLRKENVEFDEHNISMKLDISLSNQQIN